ncbi:type II toxin-antitoxin system Phd/YefM family antitoxin [Rubritalea profundi]|uniref:Uncharacterized protein n=1 Tax=Rubritalea profundi TaxID=1658618 RepID=A0A2S7U160_9BACT|nr:type II toxin-antitoxin system Phd/YefM family antitoxin [Rubritalea profundi]PQJ28739.1 hypothetical protein BSZ32_09660 [Rubritalea profundi]
MKEIGLYEAKTKLSSLVAELEQHGESILLTRHGKVVAQLSLPTATRAPKRGCMKSENFHISADFDTVELGFEDLQDQPNQKVAEDEMPYGNI